MIAKVHARDCDAVWEDQCPVVQLNHPFVPTDWIARVAPDHADLCAITEKTVIRCFTGKGLP
jgi:hypothetical protein